MNNRLEIDLPDFVSALATFKKSTRGADALLAFEGGFLIIEQDDRMAVMPARGEWHGRAHFSGNIACALAVEPPREDPVVVAYTGDRLRISTMTIGCRWETVSARFIRKVTAPDYLDLLAMDRTLPRSEIHGTGLARKIRTARSTIAGRVEKAAKLLEVADICADDLWFLIEQNIQLRLEPTED